MQVSTCLLSRATLFLEINKLGIGLVYGNSLRIESLRRDGVIVFFDGSWFYHSYGKRIREITLEKALEYIPQKEAKIILFNLELFK